MDIRKIKKLIELLEESSLTEIEIVEGEESVRLSRASAGTALAVQQGLPVDVQAAAWSAPGAPQPQPAPAGPAAYISEPPGRDCRRVASFWQRPRPAAVRKPYSARCDSAGSSRPMMLENGFSGRRTGCVLAPAAASARRCIS